MRPHGRFQYAIDAGRLMKAFGGGSRGHKPSCLRGGNSCVCFDAVVDRRASLVVCRRCNLILKPRRSSRHGRLVRSTHRHSHILRNHNFCLRTACDLLVIYQVVFGVRSARLAIRSHDHHIS